MAMRSHDYLHPLIMPTWIWDQNRLPVERRTRPRSGVHPSASFSPLPHQINYNNKDHLVGAMLIAGWDRHGGGQVYGAPIGGTLVKEKWAIDGSGSTYIWGYCDNEYR